MRTPAWREALELRCPSCGAAPSCPCTVRGKERSREDVHVRRVEAAVRIARDVAELQPVLDGVASDGRELLASLGGAP